MALSVMTQSEIVRRTLFYNGTMEYAIVNSLCVCVCRFKPLRERSRLQTSQVASLLSQIAARGQSE